MSKELYFENEHVTIWYHPESNIVHHKFHSFTHGEDLKELLNIGLELFKRKGSQKWLSDDSNNPIMKQEDLDWSKSVWRPAVIAAGWKYWAIVNPEQVAGQMLLKKLVKEYADTGVTVQFFKDADEALKWLESQEE